MRLLPEFAALRSESDRELVELAAYLHDIGKGPKARWASNGGLQKVDPDHPVGAMPMMVDMLTTNVRDRGGSKAELLLKLICYHDLAGDVLGKGRDEEQIAGVVDNALELELLFVLGKADARALVETWWDESDADSLRKRCLALIRSRAS
jgi:hypothetical protein